MLERYMGELEASGGELRELARRERQRLEQAWREVFSYACFQRTGKWTHGAYEWHVFSFEFSPAKEGPRAYELYRQQDCSEVVLLPQDYALPAVEVRRGARMDFGRIPIDLLLAPTSFAWTMAFTHESDYCGPYFALAEWQPKPSKA